MLEKLYKMIEGLHEKTRQGKIAWERTADPSTFLASFPSHSIQISPGDGVPVMELFNQNGELVAHIQSQDFTKDAERFRAREYLLELYKRAQTTAMGADKVVDDILMSLGKLG